MHRQAFSLLSAIFCLNSFTWRGGKLLIALGALALGADASTVGLLAAAYSFVPMLLSVYAGRISDRIGLRRPILVGAIAMVAAPALPALHLNLATLFLCTLLLGVGQLFIQVSTHNGIGAISTPETRSANYARLQVGASIAAMIGPFIVGVAIDYFGLKPGFWLVAFSAMLIFLPVLFLPGRLGIRPPGEERPEKGRVADLLASPGLRRSLFTGAVALCGMELFAFYIPIYGNAIGLSATMIGAVLAARASAAFAVRVFMGLLLQRYSAMAVLTATLFVGALGFAVIPLFDNAAVLLVISFVLGLGFGVAAPLTQSMTYANSPPARSGEALGLRILVNKAMQVAIPLAFGGLGTEFGVLAVFWTNAVILLLGGLVSTYDLRSRAPD